jgi:molybdate-binding protein
MDAYPFHEVKDARHDPTSGQPGESLGRSQVHVAGVHLVDARTGEANVADVQRHAGREPIVLVTLARWEEGLLTAPGNPKKLRRVAKVGAA